ncbi:MAG TPA: NAD(P)-dependent oxidoreductase [Candidatus Acidoferrum sp.]|nr:NAD(P)-dependent oxidoreductase [Candidatus Acidoferrum sp.]
MRLFVTGGTGFIGSHLITMALGAGHAVRALRRSSNSRLRTSTDREPEWITKGMADITVGDLRETDVLVHLAAAGVSPQQATWATLFRTNVLDSLELWRKAAEAGIRRLVVCGSCFEYGRSAERYEFIPANAPLEPTNAYAASKASATMAALAFAVETRVELLVLRPFHVFGEGQHEANFWPALKEAAASGGDYRMTPGEQVRDFTPVSMVARAFMHAAQRPGLQPGLPRIENVGTGNPQALRAFAEYWWKKLDARGRLLVGALPYRTGEVMRYVPEVTEEVGNHSGAKGSDALRP